MKYEFLKNYIKEYLNRKEIYGIKDEEIAKYLQTNIKNLKKFESGDLNVNMRFLWLLNRRFKGNIDLKFDNINSLEFSPEMIKWFEKISQKTGDSNDEILKKMLKTIFGEKNGKSPELSLGNDFQIWEDSFKDAEESITLKSYISREKVKKYMHIIKNTVVSNVDLKEVNFKVSKDIYERFETEKQAHNFKVNAITKMNSYYYIGFYNRDNEKTGYYKAYFETKIFIDEDSEQYLQDEELKDAYIKKINNEMLKPIIEENYSKILKLL
ncbi:MAG: hypothetical protein H7A31_00070 [Thermotogae bacterium]|nr:hypothetical protein [Thermotogota bacterium]MCP5465072.1 hypothetical protein [Thermotogota bacterium]